MKNLSIINKFNISIHKSEVHRLVSNLSNEFNFVITTLNIIFISEYDIEIINKNYLNHNTSTDIITFNYGDKSNLDGEIYISVDDAGYYANRYKVSINLEIIRLVIHGILHILGYDDMSPEDKKVMKALENKFVKKFNNLNLVD